MWRSGCRCCDASSRQQSRMSQLHRTETSPTAHQPPSQVSQLYRAFPELDHATMLHFCPPQSHRTKCPTTGVDRRAHPGKLRSDQEVISKPCRTVCEDRESRET